MKHILHGHGMPCPNRRSIRLKGYDYSQPGAYFITVVTQDRAHVFGEVVDGQMRLNEAGRMVQADWQRTAEIRPRVDLDAFVVMPNHVHGIIVLTAGCRGTLQRAPTHTVGQFGKPTSDSVPTIVRLFKSATTCRINEMRGTPGAPVWQRNYYEHIIRDDAALQRIREYVASNPVQWDLDRENLHRARATHESSGQRGEPWHI